MSRRGDGRNYYGDQRYGGGGRDSYRRDERSYGGGHDRHDRGRDSYGHGHQDRYRDDRSRSRDGRRDHHGHGGFSNRGSYGGRGNGGRPNTRPASMMVRTNYYKLELGHKPTEWIQYRVTIVKAKRDKSEDGTFLKNEDGSIKVSADGGKTLDTDRGSTELSRRILLKLCDDLKKNHGVPIVTDGSGSAYSAHDFFEDAEERDFVVLVKRDCEEDDPDKDLILNSRFLVKLSKVARIIPTDQVRELESIRQAYDIILRSAMLYAGMKAYGRSPRVFHFPEKSQEGLMKGNSLRRMWERQREFMPILGLLQAVRFCENGNRFMSCDVGVDFANREFEPSTSERVRLLLVPDGRNGNQGGEICGVRINNVHDYIRDQSTRNEIEKALKKIMINVKYQKAPTKEWTERMKGKGLSEEQMFRRNTKMRKNKKMLEDKKINQCIIWGADDPELYSFDRESPDGGKPTVMTVARYFYEAHGIKLKYPRMPMVFLGKKEWFPIELLSQAFGKMRDANSPEQVRAVLEYYDQNAGADSIPNVNKLLEHAVGRLNQYGLTVQHVLKQFNLRLSDQPIEVEAKVLPEPTLKFAENRPITINNGSWNLRDAVFSRPATISSFAVADLNGNQKLACDFISRLMRVARRHNISVQSLNPSEISNLVGNVGRRNGNSTEQIRDAIQGAIFRARTVFNFLRTDENPSIVFIILPDDTSERYGIAKMCCQFYEGVQSQCIVASKFSGQRNQDQYCSNIVMKINAKLSDNRNHARAWITKSSNAGENANEGILWVKDLPTLVLGISVSNQLGDHDAVSVICATVALDPGCMRFAQDVKICTKTEIIDDAILCPLIKNLMRHFYENTEVPPMRILVYRDGVSEGSFGRVLQGEVNTIRKAFHEIEREQPHYKNCVRGCRNGCVHCCPPITFVACMTRTIAKFVPRTTSEGAGRSKNVYSGTCIDNVITDRVVNLQVPDSNEQGESNGLLYSEPNGEGYDFLLVAHGGGKGTSKPVHYRIIVNENAVHMPPGLNESKFQPLTKDILQKMTYEMSFQYSTATKAVRLVPPVYYSARCAETVLKYSSNLRQDGSLTRRDLDDGNDERLGDALSHYEYVRTDNEPQILPKFMHGMAAHLSA